MIRFIGVAVVLLCIQATLLPVRLKAQQSASAGIEEGIEGFDLFQDISEQLPTLDSLILIAVSYSPSVKTAVYQSETEEQRLALQKKFWTNHVSLFGNMATGSQGVYIAGVNESTVNTLSNGYRYGLSVNLPLYEFISRSNRVKLSQSEIKTFESKAEEIKLTVEQLVIRNYFDLIVAQKVMIDQHNYLEQANNSVQLAELKLRDNQVSFTEYTRISEIQSIASQKYYESYGEFMVAFYNLESLLGAKLYDLKL
ncbi:TolC family protein [Algoriphagus sp. AGSA1]|uniref:TolC family protein n=1 Tax=Algoriphagus sp. AGSA1 TaxID=2907213 RepID=UPI001F39A9DD|nr:TolC family protein [Algoriphagus sp. AGSA1]MCE7053734.1 TolC family protein [Algoriphagus sp. AGSA1]